MSKGLTHQGFARARGQGRFSRRSFIRTSAGAAGAALLATTPASIFAKNTESGLVTLDSLILTYLGAPLDAAGTASWHLAKSYDFTLNLESVEQPDLAFRCNAPDQLERIHRSDFDQMRSTLVPDAITTRLLRTELTDIGTSSDGTFDGAICLAMQRPQFEFSGTANRLRFRFVDVEVTLFIDVQTLMSGEPSLVKQSTARSFLQAYVTDPARLVEPRFKLLRSAEYSGRQTFDETVRLRGGTLGIEQAAYTSEIVESTGFNSDVLKRAFEKGKLLKAIFSSSQEFKSTLKASTTVNRSTVGVTRVYFDRVFKAFVIANRTQ